MLVNLCYDGHIRNIANLPLDIFITFTVASATEFPADTLLTFTLDIWGRRWYGFGSMVISGVFSILVVAVPPGKYCLLHQIKRQISSTVQILMHHQVHHADICHSFSELCILCAGYVYTVAALALLGRFCVNIAFNIGLQYAAEILPTVVRAQGVAAVHIAGYLAALVAPQIVLLVTSSAASRFGCSYVTIYFSAY